MIANPLVRILERRLKVARKHTSMVIIIGVLAGVIMVIYFLGVKIGEETRSFGTGAGNVFRIQRRVPGCRKKSGEHC